MNIVTCESVSPQHPDKQCDILADSLLDIYLEHDPKSRVALEVLGGHGKINITGEVTSKYEMSIPEVEDVIKKVTGLNNLILNWNVVKQSPFIAQGVDIGGSGDQNINIGYATRETENYMPLEYELARNLCMKVFEKYPYDGKTQVTIDKDSGKILTVIVSFQNTKNEELLPFVKSLINADEYLINSAGEWTQGGFEADTGCCGRKLVIDSYGPEISIGGGCYSNKDSTKMDRSGAYMARRIAVDILDNSSLDVLSVKTKLAYAIGNPQPVMAVAELQTKEGVIKKQITGYDLSPKGIYDFLKLGEVKFAETAKFGHFGLNFPWK